MRLPLCLAPARTVVARKPGVAPVIPVDLGHHQAIGERQRGLEQPRTADYEDHRFADAQVRRPIITGWPRVSCLKCFRSSGRCHGSWPLAPMIPFAATAATR